MPDINLFTLAAVDGNTDLEIISRFREIWVEPRKELIRGTGTRCYPIAQFKGRPARAERSSEPQSNKGDQDNNPHRHSI